MINKETARPLGWTTIEEAKKLMESGLYPKSADMFYSFVGEHLKDAKSEDFIAKCGEAYAIKGNLFSFRNGFVVPCWSLGALLNLMPGIADECYEYHPIIDLKDKCVRYVYLEDVYSSDFPFHFESDILMANVVEAMLWLLDNGHIKKGKTI